MRLCWSASVLTTLSTLTGVAVSEPLMFRNPDNPPSSTTDNTTVGSASTSNPPLALSTLSFEQLVDNGLNFLKRSAQTSLMPVMTIEGDPINVPASTNANDFQSISITAVDLTTRRIFQTQNFAGPDALHWYPPTIQPYSSNTIFGVWYYDQRGVSVQDAINGLRTKGQTGPWLRVELLGLFNDPLGRRIGDRMWIACLKSLSPQLEWWLYGVDTAALVEVHGILGGKKINVTSSSGGVETY